MRSNDLVDVPAGDVEEFDREAGIADDLANAGMVFGWRGIELVVGTRGGEEDEHPFVPGLDHAGDAGPAPVGMLDVWL